MPEDSKNTFKDEIELVRDIVEFFETEEIKDKIVQISADALPLPNFIERRILSLAYNALLEYAKRELDNYGS